MKMKKILALLIGATMTFTSVVANAAFVEDSGYQLWDGTFAELQAEAAGRTFTVDVAVDQITFDQASAIKNFVTKPNGAAKYSDDEYNFYKAEIDIKGVGDLTYGYEASNWDSMYLRLAAIELYLKDLPQATATSVVCESTNIGFKANYDGVGVKGYNISWSGGSQDNYYPTTEDTFVSAAEMDAELDNIAVYFVYPETTEVSGVYLAGNMTYDTYFSTATPSIVGVNVQNKYSLGTVTLNGEDTADGKIAFAPKSEEAKPVIFTADLKEKTANGYIWALTFTQSADKLASFTAKFEADGVKPADRVMQDVSAVASVLGGKAAPVVLNVGLETTKTLKAATFTADDAVEATPAKVVNAPISK